MTVWWELSVKQHSRTDHNLNTLPIKVAEVLHSSIAQRDHLVIGFALIFLVLYLKEKNSEYCDNVFIDCRYFHATFASIYCTVPI